jgi:hypothetical protein
MRALAAVTAACLLTACGAGRSPVDRTWRQNAAGLVAQLRADVATVQSVPGSQDFGAQYALLVAYADMGGCSTMAAATGAPPALQRVLERTCPHLERAAALFTNAETHARPATLRRAAREAALAQPALVRAAVASQRG